MQNYVATKGKMQILQINWIEPGRKEAALQQYRKLELAERQGLEKQASMIRRKIEHLIQLNQAEQDILDAKKYGFNVKPFAIVPGAAPGKHLAVMGEKWYWTLEPVDIYTATIPPEAIKAAAFAKYANFEGCWVASPLPHPKAKPVNFNLTKIVIGSLVSAARSTANSFFPKASPMTSLASWPDPVLVASRGKVLIELARWI